MVLTRLAFFKDNVQRLFVILLSFEILKLLDPCVEPQCHQVSRCSATLIERQLLAQLLNVGVVLAVLILYRVEASLQTQPLLQSMAASI